MAGGLDAYYAVLSGAFTPVTNTYTSGAANQTVPANASSVTISVYGPGGTGGTGFDGGIPTERWTGGGAGEGGAAVSTYVIAPNDWGALLAYSVGTTTGNDSTVTGTLVAGSVLMTGATGGDGLDADDAAGGSSGGGGAGTGGNVSNTSGTNGVGGGSTGAGGAGGSGASPAGNGGNGGYPGAGASGGGGSVVFAWT